MKRELKLLFAALALFVGTAATLSPASAAI